MEFEALDQQQVNRRHAAHQLVEGRFGVATQFVLQSPAAARDDHDLARSGFAVAPRILARPIEIEGMVRMLALVQITDSQITVLKGYGNGTFEACSSVGIANSAYDVAVGDFNLDGNLDAVVVHFYLAFQINQVSIFFGDGSCKLDNETLYSIGERAIPSSVDVGDFTGDGYPDLAITSFTEPPNSQFYLMPVLPTGK